MISCLSGRLSLFPGPPQLCYISPLRLSSHLTPVPSLGSDLQSLGLSTLAPPPPLVGMQTHISGWVLEVGFDLCSEFSPFCLLHTGCCALLWVSELHPCPCAREGFHVCRNFSSFTAHSQIFRFCLDSFVSLPTSPLMWGLACLFEDRHLLPTFSRCSVGVVHMHMYF